MNMEKYIKADTVLKFINSCLEHEDKITDTEKAVLTGIKTCIERIPAADVVEVVRCRDCKHNTTRSTRQFYQWCDERHEYHVPDWFCADGEPLKDGGQDDGEHSCNSI